MNAVASNHAKLTMFIILLVGGYVSLNQLGQVWTEPFRFDFPNSADAVRQIFFCDRATTSSAGETQFNGAPDLIIEVISPDSQTRDRREKFNEYEAAGVLEYWLPDPASRTFEAYTLGSNRRYSPLPLIDGQIDSKVLSGLYFRQGTGLWQLNISRTYCPRPANVRQIEETRLNPQTPFVLIISLSMTDSIYRLHHRDIFMCLRAGVALPGRVDGRLGDDAGDGESSAGICRPTESNSWSSPPCRWAFFFWVGRCDSPAFRCEATGKPAPPPGC